MKLLKYFIIVGFATVTSTTYLHGIGAIVVPHPEIVGVLGFSFGMGCILTMMAESLG